MTAENRLKKRRSMKGINNILTSAEPVVLNTHSSSGKSLMNAEKSKVGTGRFGSGFFDKPLKVIPDIVSVKRKGAEAHIHTFQIEFDSAGSVENMYPFVLLQKALPNVAPFVIARYEQYGNPRVRNMEQWFKCFSYQRIGNA